MIYDTELNPLEDYDLSLGKIETRKKKIHHDAIIGVEEQYHYEVIKVYPNGGKDVKKVIDVQGVMPCPEWDEEVNVSVYVPYTEEELAEQERIRNLPTIEDRLRTLEEQLVSLTFELKKISDSIIEVVKKENSEMPIGDYLNPIHFEKGIQVEIGKWYYEEDKELPFECIADGYPQSILDRDYFDIIEV